MSYTVGMPVGTKVLTAIRRPEDTLFVLRELDSKLIKPSQPCKESMTEQNRRANLRNQCHKLGLTLKNATANEIMLLKQATWGEVLGLRAPSASLLNAKDSQTLLEFKSPDERHALFKVAVNELAPFSHDLITESQPKRRGQARNKVSMTHRTYPYGDSGRHNELEFPSLMKRYGLRKPVSQISTSQRNGKLRTRYFPTKVPIMPIQSHAMSAEDQSALLASTVLPPTLTFSSESESESSVGQEYSGDTPTIVTSHDIRFNREGSDAMIDELASEQLEETKTNQERHGTTLDDINAFDHTFADACFS